MKRKPNPLAPKIPAHFGPHRRAALEEAQDGWCAVCSQVIPLRTDGTRRGKYTCGKVACTRYWSGTLCKMDYRAEAKKRRAA